MKLCMRETKSFAACNECYKIKFNPETRSDFQMIMRSENLNMF